MVSNASEDFPDPERPVNTISLSRGSSTVRFLRLCSRAPLMSIESVVNASPGRLSYGSVIRKTVEHLFVRSPFTEWLLQVLRPDDDFAV